MYVYLVEHVSVSEVERQEGSNEDRAVTPCSQVDEVTDIP